MAKRLLLLDYGGIPLTGRMAVEAVAAAPSPIQAT
jgi:hypothetical protein